MTKAKISEYDASAGNNTDVNNVNIAEGCAPSGINNAIREVMAALKRFETGADGDSVTVGGNLVVSGTATLSTTSSGPINGTTIPSSKTLLVSTDIGSTVQAYDADLAAFAAKTAPTGAVVGTTDTQTLTNKTISVDNNTVSGIAASSFVLSNGSGNIDGSAAQKAIPSGTVVGTSDTQTLTNKSIDGDTNTLTNVPTDELTEPVRHSIRPSLLLDFANTKKLDPRITFTRGSTATYYDGKTVAKAEENLVTRSQELDNTTWNAYTLITANDTTAPDGTSTADRLNTVAASGSQSTNNTAFVGVSGQTYTVSVFAKAGTNSYVQLGATSQVAYANFDLSAGTVGTSSGLISSSIVDSGSGWYRCIITFTYSGNYGVYIQQVNGSSVGRLVNWTGTGAENIYLWGAQYEQRSSVTAYTPTTTQAITNYIPVLQSAASGTARFDHDPVTGESKGLLIEESRTTLLTYSADVSNAAWAKTNSNFTSNTIVAPDGTLTGDKVYEDTTSTNVHLVSQNISVTSGATYTVSAFMKKAERGFALIALITGFPTTSIQVNLTTGAVTTGTGTPLNAFSQDVGNGWFRVGFSLAANSTTTAATSYYISTDGAWANRNYTGDGYSGIYIWGAQLEAGAFATSYIPTTSAQVTRSADAASMTGTNFSSWYRADEGTMYGEAITYRNLSSDGNINAYIFGIYTSGASVRANGLALFRNSDNMRGLSGDISGTTFVATVTDGWPSDQFTKGAVAYDSDEVVASALGITPVSTAFTSVKAEPNTLVIGQSWNTSYSTPRINGTIKKLAYYPARLTNAELQGLTS